MPTLSHLIPQPGPIRVLVAANLGRSIGNGILVAVVILYFTRLVGISPERLGVGLAIAAVLNMLVSIPAGHVSDVIGPRTSAIIFVVLQGVLIIGYVLVGGFIGFVITASLVGMVEAAADAARGALIAGVIPAGARVRARAYLRSINNIGISTGAALGGIALAYDSWSAYAILLIGCGLLFVGGGLCYLALPPVPSVAKPSGGPRWVVLRDKPFAAVGLINSILVMNTGILVVALPIWIAQRTSAPTVVYSGILLFNTIMVVLFQVRASRGAEDVAGGARALRRCGVLLAGCCGLFALAAGQPLWLAIVFLIAGATAHVFGELLYSAGAWALVYELAPEHAHGQYQGLFGMTTHLGSVITPIAVTTLIIGIGWPGWLMFAIVLLVAGMASPAIGRWALRTREPSSHALSG